MSTWPWNDPPRWTSLRRGEDCPLCHVATATDMIGTLSTSMIRVPAAACVPGYVCVIHGTHVVELHDLSPTERAAFIDEVARVSAAVKQITGAAKINLLSLGNLVPHLHMHVCPRRPGDRCEGRALDPGDVAANVYAAGEHARFVAVLRTELEL